MYRHPLKGKTVVALVSGGLDSTTIVRWLSLHGVEVIAVTVDLGQPDEIKPQTWLIHFLNNITT